MKKIMPSKKKILWTIVLIVAALLIIPQSVKNPVEGCGPASYNHKTFWHPWGDHHHHGVDIFASSGTPIRSAVPLGIVIATTCESQFGKGQFRG